MFLFLSLSMPAEIKSITAGAVMLNDELIAKTGEGNSEAFRLLYSLTDKAVYGFILSILKNHHDAEDVMQDTYLKIRECAHLYKSMGKPMAWVFTIARNCALMKIRQKKKMVELTPREDVDETGFDQVSDLEDRLVLEAAFSVLSDTERQIVMLHAVSGIKHREIAMVLELPLSTVLSKYARALSKLKKHLENTERSGEND